MIDFIIDFILHVDKYIAVFFQNYGAWTYLILFLIVFIETGLVVFPFLPGDSLIFVVGALGATGALDVKFAAVLLMAAAILGNTQNYYIGKYIGHRAFQIRDNRFFKKEYLYKTHKFYEKHGGKTIFISRFMPIIRTFAPFVAGIGKMRFVRFMSYNILGGLFWVLIFIFAGYYFGNIPVVQKNFTLVILAIIFISLLPSIIVYIQTNFLRRK
ncbi:MAG: DedA family protein [Peptococcaceae bacterium]|jgi:membrane-associated protein|nr:DedA family protein [Peptococcaceae bacterium]